jgi:hypothetical protein
MSRREIVLMVSRVIAVLLVIPSLISLVLTIPTALMNFYMRQSLMGAVGTTYRSSLMRAEGMGLLSILLGFGLHLLAALAFWQCGSMIERMLLPSGSGIETAD